MLPVSFSIYTNVRYSYTNDTLLYIASFSVGATLHVSHSDAAGNYTKLLNDSTKQMVDILNFINCLRYLHVSSFSLERSFKIPAIKMSIQQDHYPQALPADWLLRFLTGKNYRILRNICAALIPLMLCVLPKKWGEYAGIFDHFDWILTYLLLTSVFYINIYLLVPGMFYQGKFLRYLAALAGTIAFVCLISFAFHELVLEKQRLMPRTDPKTSIYGVLVITVILTPFYLISTAFKLLQRWVEDTQRIDELEKRALQSELKALRNQIHPHFLFNMLNNIMVVNKTEPELASGIILKLSDFLRYLLYNSNGNEVSLSNEIRFIEDFLELEQLRRDNFSFEIEYDPANLIGVKIPAHILLTLAENAAKHSADPIKPSFVKFRIGVAGDQIMIRCENSVPALSLRAETGGLGLANMRRRLELLFGNRFGYHASTKDSVYIVDLSLLV